MIMFSGDLHGNEMRELTTLNTKNVKKSCEENKKNYEEIRYHIILGDVGFLFPHNEKQDQYLIKWFNEKPYKTLCVFGNHEAYSEIYKLPRVDIGLGNPVYRVSDKVYYLQRGKIYTIEGKTFLVLGGGLSIDKEHRIEGIDWWKEEYWKYSEQEELFQTLKETSEVDYVVSHTACDYFIDFLEQHLKSGLRHYIDDTVKINNEVNGLIKFKHWYCGHYHTTLTRKNYTCLYKELRFI